MATKDIPACRTFICDVCKTERPTLAPFNRPDHWAVLSFERHSYYEGGAGFSMLLCDTCADQITAYIDRTTKEANR